MPDLIRFSTHSSLQGYYLNYLTWLLSRLANRWVTSHLFSACLVEEAVELLVAHLFVKPLPFTAPCSRITGFLRLKSSLVLCGMTNLLTFL